MHLIRRFSFTRASYKSFYYNLSPSRGLVLVQGPDASAFLHGLITNSINSASKDSIYAAFLTPSGRVLYDSFIYPAHNNVEWRKYSCSEEPSYIVEVDSRGVEGLVSHLTRYKLRAKCDIRILEDWNVWSVPSPLNCIGCKDNRAPDMGYRAVLLSPKRPQLDTDEGNICDYHLQRYLTGVPEGIDEIFEGAAFPMESCIDHMGGRCYIGQELTIRTYHSGVIRKRIVPAMFYDLKESPPETLSYRSSNFVNPSPRTPIYKFDKGGPSVGRFCCGIGNVGLALARLDDMFSLPSEKKFRITWPNYEGRAITLGIKVFKPSWWPEAKVQTDDITVQS